MQQKRTNTLALAVLQKYPPKGKETGGGKKAAPEMRFDPILSKIPSMRSVDTFKAREYLDALTLGTEILIAQRRQKYATEAAARQNEVDSAKAKADIARYEAEAEKHRRSAIPARPEDPRLKGKARIMGEIERLRAEEREEIHKVTGGKPEAEWSEETKDELVRIQNMYADARDQKSEELRGYL